MYGHSSSLLSFTDLNNDGHHGGEGEDINKNISDGIPLATSCNDKPCEFEDEIHRNSDRLPSFIKPITKFNQI